MIKSTAEVIEYLKNEVAVDVEIAVVMYDKILEMHEDCINETCISEDREVYLLIKNSIKHLKRLQDNMKKHFEIHKKREVTY